MIDPNGFSQKFRHMLLAGSISCLSPIASAPASSLSESPYLDDVPVVLTASRLTQPVDEAPAAVTVIDRQMIKDSGAWELSEVFRLVPGMYVAYHAARFYSTDSIVSYRGLMSETMSHRMQVLVDGRSVYSPLYGGVIWNDIPVSLDDIERIEVIRSPNAASYGANSFVGIINIITRHSAETQGTSVSLSAGRGRTEGTMRHGGRNGGLTYRLTLGLRNDQGEDADIRNPTSQNYIWTKNKFDDKRIRLLTLRADYQLNAADTLEFQVGYNGGRRQGGEVLDVYAPDKQADNHLEQFQWRRALADGGEFSLKFYHMLESSSATLLDRNGTLAGNGDVIAHRYDLEAQHTFAPSQNTRVVWGGSVRHDRVFAPYELGIYDPDLYQDRTFRLARLFGNLEWRLRPDLVLNGGAMLENNNYTGSDITPRAALNWHFQPGHTLRVSRSYATRTPSVYEKRSEEYFRNSAGYVNLPPQKPERVVSDDIGYLGKIGGLDVDFRLFHDVYTELIADRTNAVSNNNLNSGSATINGFETQLKWQLGERTRLIYGLSHGVVASPNVDKIPYTNSVPTNSQSLMLSHRFDQRWSASLVGYQVGETHFSRTDYAPAENRGYFIGTQRRWDGRIAYAFRVGETSGEMALLVQNLANADYFEFRHDNQALGRTAWINLKLDM